MFEKKQIMTAMEQTIELFESFGGDENAPHFKYAFDNVTNSPPSTQRQRMQSHHHPDGNQVAMTAGEDGGVNPRENTRESYERKVVPLQAKVSRNIENNNNVTKTDLTITDDRSR